VTQSPLADKVYSRELNIIQQKEMLR